MPEGIKSRRIFASRLLSQTELIIFSVWWRTMKLNTWLNICPNEVFPAAFAPIRTSSFLYRKFGHPLIYSPDMYDFTMRLGYDRFRLKSLNARKLSSSILITIITGSHHLITSYFTNLEYRYYIIHRPYIPVSPYSRYSSSSSSRPPHSRSGMTHEGSCIRRPPSSFRLTDSAGKKSSTTKEISSALYVRILLQKNFPRDFFLSCFKTRRTEKPS